MEKGILIVDDEKDIRQLLYQALTQMGGYRVEVAKDGEEALQKIENSKFDLVLTDMRMPKMDGLQLVKEISKKRPEIATVVMSGHGSIDAALEAVRRGASDFLSKPFNLPEILLRLNKAMEERARLNQMSKLINQLEESIAELKKLDQIKSEFVAVASHELRTPLTAIKNAVQLLLMEKVGELNENQKKFLAMAERNINRLMNILNDLLNLSRIESGKMVMKLEELNLRSILELIYFSFKPQAEEKSIQLRLDLPAELPPVYGDKEKVEQILSNLVSNSLKFTPEKGEIVISAEPIADEEGMMAIAVKDTGIGIPAEHLDKIFEKFYQVENSLQRSHGGTGLGLAITKGLVEAQKGKIFVHSEPEKGSTFTFTLPISQGERREVQFRYVLDREFQRARDNQSPLSLLLAEIRDVPGEEKEVILQELENIARESIRRKSDIILAREKEKILVALLGVDKEGAQVVRQRFQENIQKKLDAKWPSPPKVKIGIATFPEEALSPRELYQKAQEDLQSKS